MVKKLFTYLLTFIGLISAGHLFAQNEISFSQYHKAGEVQQIMKKFQQSNPAKIQVHSIATSPGGEEITVLEIGKDLKNVPAIFVGANFEGNIPLSTEGALRLAKMLLDSSAYTTGIKWYILPLPNPDAAKGYFSGVQYNRTLNDFKVNNDMDEATSEDGFDDLNGDGLITQMRVKNWEGTHVISKNDPRILVKADASEGERGEYKIYTEGIDNDGDGMYNEDGDGGINVRISFPHLFPHNNPEAGQYSGQTPEVYGIMRFITDRPEIVMVYTLGSSDFCLAPPKGGRKGGANLQNIKIPARYARMFDVDPNQTFTMDEIIALVKERVPAEVEVTPSMVAGILGLGAAVNPLDEDLKFYTKFAGDYKKYLEGKKFSTERLEAPGDKDGSFELWAYYHLGVPSFSMNLFTIPKVKEDKKDTAGVVSIEEVEKMSAEEFSALGEEKITAFLKAQNAPERFSAKGIMEMMGTGKLSPKQMAEMMKNMPKPAKKGELSEKEKALLAWSDNEWNGKGFVNWQKFDHPELGEVEIGGFAPYLETTPKPEKIDSLLSIQLPWLLQLSKKIPDISVAGEKITDLGGGIFKLEIYVENKGYLPYPIAMGQRNNTPSPVIITIDGEAEILEGLKRTPLGSIDGSQVKKLTWLLKTDKKSTITAKVESAAFGTEVKQIKIGG